MGPTTTHFWQRQWRLKKNNVLIFCHFPIVIWFHMWSSHIIDCYFFLEGCLRLISLLQTCQRGFWFLMSPHLLVSFLLGISTSMITLRPYLNFLVLTLTVVIACSCSFWRSRMFGMMWGHMPTPTTSPLWRIGGAPTNCCCVQELIRQKNIFVCLWYNDIIGVYELWLIYHCNGNTFLKHIHSWSLIICGFGRLNIFGFCWSYPKASPQIN